MLSQLCLRLGLPTRFPANALRIAHYMVALRSADDNEQFYSRSFKTDSWGTAKALLRLRDELVANGWKLSSVNNIDGASARLKTLARIEAIAGKNVICLTDMINPILTRLERVEGVGIESITIVDELSILPPVWQKLINALKGKGVQIMTSFCSSSDIGLSTNNAPSTDLQKLSAFLHNNQLTQLSGDGSLVILESDDEVQAADFVSALLLSVSCSDDNVVIIRGDTSSFLDHLLQQRNLPALGGIEKSSMRGYMQLLPLALEVLWEPFDPSRLLELLTLAAGPISPSIARHFVYALKIQPGIAGDAWEKAWQLTRENLVTWDAKTEEDRVCSSSDIGSETNTTRTPSKAVLEKEAFFREWLEPFRFDPQKGVPAVVAVQVCERVKLHAYLRFNSMTGKISEAQIQVFLRTAVFAETLLESIKASGSELITRSQLLRMMESAAGEGYTPDTPEASTWTPVDHPGQIIGSADLILWWGFVSNRNHGVSTAWSNEEIDFLEKLEVYLDSPQNAVVREAKSWYRPLTASAGRLVVVKPRTVAGRTVAAHPFYHEVAALVEATPHTVRTRIIKQAHEIYSQAVSEISDHKIVCRPVLKRALPRPRPVWNITPSDLSRSSENATSLERLLSCPMSWLFEHKKKFRFGNLLSVSAGEQLSGNLAHEVFAAVFSHKEILDKHDEEQASMEVIEMLAAKYFEELCPKIAAPLLLPGNSLERQKLKKAIVDGTGNLANLIREAGFSRIQCETEHEQKVDGIVLRGRIDMVLSHPDNYDYIIDLKWTRRAPYRRREISEGRAIQLALYAALLKSSFTVETKGGYYLIGQRQLFSAAQSPFPIHSFVDGPTLDQTFEVMLDNYRNHMKVLSSGTICATGFAETAPVVPDESGIDFYFDDDVEQTPGRVPGATLTLEPPCRICNFGRLCGKKEFDS